MLDVSFFIFFFFFSVKIRKQRNSSRKVSLYCKTVYGRNFWGTSTFSIATFSLTTLSMMFLFLTLSLSVSSAIMLRVIRLCVVFLLLCWVSYHFCNHNKLKRLPSSSQYYQATLELTRVEPLAELTHNGWLPGLQRKYYTWVAVTDSGKHSILIWYGTLTFFSEGPPYIYIYMGVLK